MAKIWVLVENAGYDNERDVETFEHWHEAAIYRDKYYSEEEKKSAHVEICVEIDGDRSYDIG